MTLIVICPAPAELPAHAPELIDGDRVLRPGGGGQSDEGDTFIFFIYDATSSATVEVMHEGVHTADLRFPNVPRPSCQRAAAPGLEWVACESIDVIRMHVAVEIPAGDAVLAIEGSAIDGQSGEDLGFYVFDILQSADDLSMKVGFRPMSAPDSTIELRRAETSGGLVEIGRTISLGP